METGFARLAFIMQEASHDETFSNLNDGLGHFPDG